MYFVRTTKLRAPVCASAQMRVAYAQAIVSTRVRSLETHHNKTQYVKTAQSGIALLNRTIVRVLWLIKKYDFCWFAIFNRALCEDADITEPAYGVVSRLLLRNPLHCVVIVLSDPQAIRPTALHDYKLRAMDRTSLHRNPISRPCLSSCRFSTHDARPR